MNKFNKIFVAVLLITVSVCCFACKKKTKKTGDEGEAVVEIVSVANVNDNEEINLFYGVNDMDKYALTFEFNPAEASYKDLAVDIDNTNVVEFKDGELVAKNADGTAIVQLSAKKGNFSAEFVVTVMSSNHPELLLMEVNGKKGTDLDIDWKINETNSLNITAMRPVEYTSALKFEFKSSQIDYLNIGNLDGSMKHSVQASGGTDGYDKLLSLEDVQENGFSIRINNKDALPDKFSFTVKVSYIYFTGEENTSLNQTRYITINVIK